MFVIFALKNTETVFKIPSYICSATFSIFSFPHAPVAAYFYVFRINYDVSERVCDVKL